ncbi:MAG: polyphosphate kinase 1 [Deltaproteobacteria bacterium]|nr:polyphosphate kinase 1 [Deltaproteobacteria bacterium]
MTDPKLFLNRELSWLEFNQRVLDEASDPSVPLLERVKFLSIISTNLDEFFMIRVAGLKHQRGGEELLEPTADGLSPGQQLEAICARAQRMVRDKYALFRDQVRPALVAAGIHLAPPSQWSPETTAWLEDYFVREIFPVLTPMVVDPGHPFPHLRNKSLNLAVTFESDREEGGIEMGVVQVPSISPRLVAVRCATQGKVYAFLEDLLARNMSRLFPGVKILGVSAFRVTRNWDLEIDEEEAEDLLVTIQQELRRRDRGSAVRLEVAAAMEDRMRELLCHVLRLEPSDVYAVDGPLHFGDLMAITGDNDRRELKDEPFTPQVVPPFRDAEDPFALIAERDVLLQHPYESYESVVDFVSRAAADPKVLAIKITLYRAGTNSPFVKALAHAAENGKQVTALVELKARFEEEANIVWARALEESGVHVVYGLLGLKTHAKVCLVVRREATGLRRYVHLGTGNYNPSTARVYTDLSYFSARADLGEDVSALFNLLTGYCEPEVWRVLSVAPINLRESLTRMIHRERDHARAGRPAGIIAKLNALVDREVIEALYSASQAGVKIDLIVRGICCLRPGVPGVSETIRVVSIVDRYLEHARVFAVENGGAREVYMSSADWMPRNLERRVEVLIPIAEPKMATWLRDEVLRTMLADTVKARVMRPDGSYERRAPVPGEAPVRSQQRFMDLARERARTSFLHAPLTPFRAPQAQLNQPAQEALVPSRKKKKRDRDG